MLTIKYIKYFIKLYLCIFNKIKREITTNFSYIIENQAVHTLENISEIEDFVNKLIDKINKIKYFSVNDLDINKKIKVLCAFAGYLFQTQLHSKGKSSNPIFTNQLNNSVTNKIAL